MAMINPRHERSRPDYDDYDDFFTPIDSAIATAVATMKEVKEDTNPEKEYIDLCFIDLVDTNTFSSVARNGNIDSTIKIESRKRKSNTFSSYKSYYDEIYNKMNLIEDSILKVKLKYPHCNVAIEVEDSYIGLVFIF